jgi:hypothetical protein
MKGADTTIAAGNITDLRNRRPILPAKIGSGYPGSYVAGSVAAPAGAATVTLTPGAVNTMTPAAPGAYNVDNFAGLASGQWADVKINDVASPATLRDFAVGTGNIWTNRAASIVMAAVADRVRVSFDGARYSVSQPTLQAGQASGTPSANDTATGGSETLGMLLPFNLPGAWAVDGDSFGGGVVGGMAAGTLQGPTYAVAYDHGTTTFTELSRTNTDLAAQYAANFQLWPDAEA